MAYRNRFPMLVLLMTILLLTSCNLSGSRPMEGAAASGANAAAEYCAQNGGVVEVRYPYYGTNGEQPLQLAGLMQVCAFTDQADGSKIHISAETLYAEKPTLAALAYLAKTPMGSGDPSSNPSSRYCTQLGGTDLFGGVSAAGGGWAKKDGTDVIAMCIFPDLSSIDSWGLTYHSTEVIRGADLTNLFRYHGSKP